MEFNVRTTIVIVIAATMNDQCRIGCLLVGKTDDETVSTSLDTLFSFGTVCVSHVYSYLDRQSISMCIVT